MILMSSIALIGLVIYGASGMSSMQNKNDVQRIDEEKSEKHVKWKAGFTKTKGMVYVPATYEAAYNTLVDIYNERKEKEELQSNVEDLFYEEAKLMKFIREQNEIVPQDYPTGTMISPSVDLIRRGKR